jgi:RimJ/RimL family protein N-acetyltransferase
MPKSKPIFVTDRLICRRWLPQDLSALLEVYGDVDAMRWVGDGVAITPDECSNWLAVTENNYQTRGYGMFALEDPETHVPVGFCGLVHPGGQIEAEIKYALKRKFWGRGLATEAARALLAYGSNTHGVDYVIATTAPENVASHRVLLKAGMEKCQLRRDDDGAYTQLFEWRPAGSTKAA